MRTFTLDALVEAICKEGVTYIRAQEQDEFVIFMVGCTALVRDMFQMPNDEARQLLMDKFTKHFTTVR